MPAAARWRGERSSILNECETSTTLRRSVTGIYLQRQCMSTRVITVGLYEIQMISPVVLVVQGTRSLFAARDARSPSEKSDLDAR